MAGAAQTADDEPAAKSAPAAAKKGGGVGVLIAAVALSTAASAGTTWFLLQRLVAQLPAAGAAADGEAAPAAPEVPKDPANYVALEPAFVVNLASEHQQRFLQVQVEVMSRKPKAIELVQRHAPRIRSQLLLLFGQQRAEDLSTRDGKEALQQQVLAEIQNILRAETGSADVEAVYFTSFVMQ